jgi:hypothetical protein
MLEHWIYTIHQTTENKEKQHKIAINESCKTNQKLIALTETTKEF